MHQTEGTDEVLPSLGENTIVRLIADVIAAACGFVSAVVTARVLGPSGKGTLSTLLFIAVLLSYACSLGLGDAAIVLVRSRAASIEEALASSFAPLAITTMVGCLVLVLIGWIADWSAIVPAVVVAGGLVAVSTFLRVLVALENARERLKMTSLIFAVSSATSAIGAILFVAILNMGIAGGALAALCGPLVGGALALWDFSRRSVSLIGPVSTAYLRRALSFGVPSEAAYILVALSQRVDLLIVYAILGEADAGRYTIALTLGQLAAYAPFALATASFPRLAGLDAKEVSQLVEKLSRITLASALGVAFTLFIMIPMGVVSLFGEGFQDAVVPALVLTCGSVVWSEQWLLARAAAARGDSRLYFISFGSSLMGMVILDLLLVPGFGLIGAAAASVASALLGLVVCLMILRRQEGWAISLRRLTPSFADIREIALWLKDFVVRARKRAV